jgi:hypothetical protein
MGTLGSYALPPDIITGQDGLKTIVQQQSALAQQYAASMSALIDALTAIDVSIPWGTCTMPSLDKMGLDGLDKAVPTIPSVGVIVVDDVEFLHATPVLPDPVISITDPPPFTVPDPGTDIPPAPVVTWPIFTAAEPQPTDIPIPSAPPIDLPPPPVISGISIPSPPDYAVPEFDGVLPVDDLTPPNPVFSWNESPYTSQLKEALSDKLYAVLTEGGTGLDEATEQAIYDRAISRQADEEEAKYNETLNYFASRGCPIPPGPLAGALLEIRNVILQAREDLNNDILVQQSKLAQENTHFTWDQSRQWEDSLMMFADKVQQRAFDAAKFAVTAALEIYRSRVEAYAARLEAYKAQAQVYVARIQGEAAKAEFYKAQIEGVKASVEVQKAFVDAYQAQIQGVRALVELYTAELEGAKIRADIDATKIQNFVALVQSFAARVQAVTARYEGYKAQIQGEAVKAETYKARVEAYEAQVNAYKTRADIDIARITAEVEHNKGQVNLFLALVDKYKAEVDRAIRKAEVEATIEGVEIERGKAQTVIYAAELDTTAKVYAASVDDLKARADVCIQQAENQLREATLRAEIQSATIRAQASAGAQVAAAALGAISSSAHVGISESKTDSRGYQTSIAESYRETDDFTTFIQHIYPHAES